MSESLQQSKSVWVLTGRVDDTSTIQVFEITSTPFQVGRRAEVSLTLPGKMVSNLHAELTEEDGALWIRDFQSTNGTFVNGRPVTSKERLQEGDLIQIANVTLRLNRASSALDCRTQAVSGDPQSRAASLVQFDKLMSEKAVVPYYQPIVALPEKRTIGYEALARSRLFGLQTPRDMFLAASQLDLEEELSRVCRFTGIEEGKRIPRSMALFLNTHPAEIVTFGLLDSLRDLRKSNPNQPITLEVHEAAVTDLETMQTLRDELKALDIQLAFDDFGAGQSRLVALTKVCPDIVKFDMHLIRDIHLAPPPQQQMLANLVRMVCELGIIALAEGIECEEEHALCCKSGFKMAQGYFYGKPAPISSTMSAIDESSLPV